MRVADLGKNLTLVSEDGEVKTLLEALNEQSGLHLHGEACGCKAFYVLATKGMYPHVYGVRSREPISSDQVHVHMEPDTRR